MKRYWWVNQGRTFKLASQLQCIWAPFTTKTNKKIFHWENMDQVKLDDVVFSYFKGHIVSYNIVKKTSYRAERPFQDQQPDAPWKNIGRRIDLIYNILEQPININKINNKLKPFLSISYSPYDVAHNKANQGYLFEIPIQASEILFQEIKNISDDSLENNIAISENTNIEDNSTGENRHAQTKIRVGQTKFRNKLIKFWNNKCCITNFSKEMLTASHIKPWRHSNKKEKVDVYNGLLLSPSYNAAFDLNFISFDDNGKLLISSKISSLELAKIGIDPNVKIKGIKDQHKKYLKFHRESLGHKYK